MLWQRETLIYGFCTGRRRKQCLPKKKGYGLWAYPTYHPPYHPQKILQRGLQILLTKTSKALFYLRKKSLPRWVTDLGRTFQSKSLYIVLTVFLIHIQGRENIDLSIVYISTEKEKLQSRDSHSSESPFLWVFLHGSWGQLVHLDQVVRPNLE